ncbi:hypothetical protein, partial [Endozoicomonas sp. ALB122]
MHPNADNFGVVDSTSLPPVSTSLGEEPSGVNAGRSVTVPEKEIEKTALLHDLPEELTLKIFR